MTSKRKIEANRRNAKESSGPRTARGKNHTRFNALVTGIYSRAPILRGEDPEEYRQLVADLYKKKKVDGPSRRNLIDQLAMAHWGLKRVVRARTCLLKLSVVDLLSKAVDRFPYADREFYRKVMTQPSLVKYLHVPLELQFEKALELMAETEKKGWSESELNIIEGIRAVTRSCFDLDYILTEGHLAEDAKFERLQQMEMTYLRQIAMLNALLEEPSDNQPKKPRASNSRRSRRN